MRLSRPTEDTEPILPRNRALGLDLGQVSDYTALALVEWTETERPVYALRHLERVPLGTSYPAIAKHVRALMESAELKNRTQLLADGTGGGRPVMDILRGESLTPMPVVVHGGRAYTVTDDGWHHVPKRELVATAQALLQDRRLRFPRSLPLVKTLEEELLKFEVKITDAGSDTYGAWREGSHDDLVFALCLGCWYGERMATTDAYLRRHPTGTVVQHADQEPKRPSLIGRPTLVKNDDGTWRIERVA